MSFAFQNWIWLLAAIPAAVWIVHLARTSHTSLVRWRFASSLASRLGMVACLILAMAGFTLVKKTDDLGVYFVVDLSKSIAPEDQKQALEWVAQAVRGMDVKRDRCGLVLFGADASVDQMLDTTLTITGLSAVINHDYTDISQAIRLTVASFPSDIQKRLILLTDGEENLGDAVEAVREARAAGVDVWIHPLDTFHGRDVAVEKITIPVEAKTGEAFDVLVHTRFTGAKPGETKRGTMRIWRNRKLLGSFDVELGAGEDVFRIPQKILAEDGGGGYEYEAVLETAGDRVGENNRAFGYTRIEGEARVLLVEPKGGHSRDLESALRAGGIKNLDKILPPFFPATMSELQNYDAVILDNVPADVFTPGATGQMQLIKDYVESHGGGLLMVGGDRSFGVGGYYRSPVEEALPVTMDIRKRKMRVSMALVIAVDQSGSMAMTVPGGQTKLQLANEACCRVVELLDEKDKVGIVYVDTAPMWSVTIQPATGSAKQGMFRDIRSNKGGGGGIYVHTALTAAYAALDKVEAMIKHVILFSDASDSEQREHCIDQAIAERKKGRTLTVIGMGDEKDQHGEFLKDLAKAGDGRISFVEDVRKLPSIFTSETMTASKSAIVEADFVPALVGPAAAVQGIDWSKAPQLHGYITTTMKDRGEMILQGTEEDPVLAKWQYGLGRSVAFTSDSTGRWAKDWLAWDGYRKLWPQLVRWTSRRAAAEDCRVGLHFDQGRGKIVLDAFDANGEPRNFQELKARVTGPDGKALALPLVQRGNGRYDAEFPTGGSGAYFVTVGDKTDSIVGRAGGAVSYSPEYRVPEARSLTIDSMLAVGGGRRLDLPQGLFEHVGIPARAPREIAFPLLVLALALLLIDVACRRVAIPELVSAMIGKMKARSAPQPPALSSDLMERLKAVKEDAVPPPQAVAFERIIRDRKPAEPVVTIEKPPPAAAPPPAAPVEEGGYMKRLLDAKRKAKGQ